MSDFHVSPDSLAMASAKFLDLQVASARILGILRSGVGHSGGMAGNDDAGRAFGRGYDPTAQSISRALASANKQLGDTADGLLAMAFNYLQAEQGSNFLVPKAMGNMEQSCRADEVAVAIPSAVGVGQESSLPLVGKFWPQGDPARLRQVAATWREVAALVEELGRRGSVIVVDVTNTNTGQAIDVFAQTWAPMTTLLSDVASVAGKLATALDSFAQRIDDERRNIELIAAGIGVTTAIGIGLTIFSFGASDAIAGGVDATEVGAAAAAAAAFAADVEAGEVAALVGADVAIDSTIVALPVIVPAAAEAEFVGAGSLELIATVVPPGVALFLTDVQNVAAAGDTPNAPLAGSIGDPLLNGAIPPEPGSPFPPLSPQDQAAALAWVRSLPPIPTPTSSAWGAYQVRVAGPVQYVMPTGDGRTVQADGFRPLDGAIIDAKYTSNPSCSPYNLDNRGDPSAVFQPVYEKILVDENDEFNRYQAVIGDPSNHAQFLESEVSDPKLVPYFQFLMAQQHVKGLVRLVP